MKRLVSAIWIIWILVEISFTTCYANYYLYLKDTADKKPKKILCAIKFGQGGFNDSRSLIGKLGGGQLALSAQYYKYPIALSYSEEYYTNSADPTEPYEIFSMWAFHTNYSQYFFRKNRLNLFAGPGIGMLQVLESPGKTAHSWLLEAEAGVNAKLLWKFGLYASYKYLYAYKQPAIDFSEHVMLVGITFNFGLLKQ